MQSQCKTEEVSPNAHTPNTTYIHRRKGGNPTTALTLCCSSRDANRLTKYFTANHEAPRMFPLEANHAAGQNLPVRVANKGLPEFSSNHGRCVVPVHGSSILLVESRRMNPEPSRPLSHLLTIPL